MDDSKSVFLINASKDKSAVMAIRCIENATSLVLSTQEYFGSGAKGMLYRIDKGEQQVVAMSIIDGKVLGLLSGKDSIPFIKQFIGAETLVFRMTNFRKEVVTYEFELQGLDKEIGQLQEACNWSTDKK
jgi:type VI secretion system protein VasI